MWTTNAPSAEEAKAEVEARVAFDLECGDASVHRNAGMLCEPWSDECPNLWAEGCGRSARYSVSDDGVRLIHVQTRPAVADAASYSSY
jgi:carbonic anhydrase